MKINFTFKKPLIISSRQQDNTIGFLTFKHNDIEFKKNVLFSFSDLFYNFSDIESVSFDLLIISIIIYNADKLIERRRYSLEGWSRELSIELPVKNLDVWNSNKDSLIHLIQFLTGDLWSISFREESAVIVNNVKKGIFSNRKIEHLSLFSGGMDSLIGAIDLFSNLSDKTLGLISIWDSKNEKGDQKRLTTFFRKKNKNFVHYNYKCGLGKAKFNGFENPKGEPSSRSRSFLFLSIGLYITNCLKTGSTLLIPENGTISLNHPLTPSRSGTCSTRTTHPEYINKFNNLLSKLGLENVIKNPYQFKTKGEMISECKDIKLFKEVYPLSNSCGNRRFSHSNHCGACMPCVYRLISIHHSKLENQDYNLIKIDHLTIDLLKKHKTYMNILDFIELVRLNPQNENIKRNLIANGLHYDANIDGYVGLVSRTISQARSWLKSQASDNIKEYIGL